MAFNPIELINQYVNNVTNGGQATTQTPATGTTGTGTGGTLKRLPGLGSTVPLENPATSGADALKKWGYEGPLGLSDTDKAYLDYVKSLSQSQDLFSGLKQAQSFLGGLLTGDMNPYQQNVIDAARSEAMRSYDDMAKALATKFSALGGYFGGGHSMAQAKLADESARSLNQMVSNLLYQGYNDMMNRGLQASEQMGQQVGLEGNLHQMILSNLLGGANLETERSRYDIGQYQQALEREYQEWVRSRGENMNLLNLAQLILGTQVNAPYAVSGSNPLLNILNTFASIAGTYAMGKKQDLW